MYNINTNIELFSLTVIHLCYKMFCLPVCTEEKNIDTVNHDSI